MCLRAVAVSIGGARVVGRSTGKGGYHGKDQKALSDWLGGMEGYGEKLSADWCWGGVVCWGCGFAGDIVGVAGRSSESCRWKNIAITPLQRGILLHGCGNKNCLNTIDQYVKLVYNESVEERKGNEA
jgi:ribosome modulation factor